MFSLVLDLNLDREKDMHSLNLVLKQINLLMKICLVVGSLSSVVQAQILGSLDQDIIIIENSMVVFDKNNTISINDGIGAIGDYKYSLDGSLPNNQLQNTQSSIIMKVVKNRNTGRVGLTNGQLFIKYAEGVNGPDLALNYGLSVIDVLPSLNRIVVQLNNLEDYERIKESMKLDDRVISTELDIYYAALQLQ